MKARALLLVALLLVAACSKITLENFAKIKEGMSEPDVKALLGPPKTTTSVQVFGVSGTHSTWEGGGAVVSIRFVNGKVATKAYRKSEIRKPG
jgi:hypothetical protein